jgi:hypothetical protein
MRWVMLKIGGRVGVLTHTLMEEGWKTLEKVV